MCGRYDLSDNPAAIKARFKVPVVPDFSANPDVRPTNMAPVVRRSHASQEREVAMLRWGLVPMWAKELKFGARCINARAETLATTPSFRVAYRKRRCLVPVNAFFEWAGEPGHKVKWRIGLKDEPLFALAGLWEWWKDDRHDARERSPGSHPRPDARRDRRARLRSMARCRRSRDRPSGAISGRSPVRCDGLTAAWPKLPCRIERKKSAAGGRRLNRVSENTTGGTGDSRNETYAGGLK
jgi:hypothetical protein